MGRRKSLGKKYTNLEKQINNYLAVKGVYDLTDFILVDELVYNIYLSDQAKDEIETNGFMVNVVRDAEKDPLMQSNQAVSIYYSALKHIETLSTKLGMTVQERAKLQIVPTDIPENDPLKSLLKDRDN